MCPGVCKDRLSDAFERFGRVRIVKRTIAVSGGHAIFRRNEEPFWSAGGLIHDGHGRVLLVRHVPESGWDDAWVTPGGRLEDGETVLDGLVRGVREEVGVDVANPSLTRIIQQNLTDGSRVRHGYFAQFIVRAVSIDVHGGPDVIEALWFDRLPESLVFREDYVEDFERIRGGTSF